MIYFTNTHFIKIQRFGLGSRDIFHYQETLQATYIFSQGGERRNGKKRSLIIWKRILCKNNIKSMENYFGHFCNAKF